MPVSLGKKKSTLVRGLKPGKVDQGMVGQWLIAARWQWNHDNEVFVLVHDDSEKLHLMFVYTWELEAVMKAINGTYSHSRHLAGKLLVEAVFMNAKMRLWSHGLVRPSVVNAEIHGTTEEHAERLPQVKSPWVEKKPAMTAADYEKSLATYNQDVSNHTRKPVNITL